MANAFIFSASMTSGLPQLRSVFPPHPVLWPPSAPSAGPTSPRLSPPSSPPRRPAASKAPSREGMPPKAMMKKIKVHRPPNSAPRGKRSPSYVPLPPVNREAMWRYMEGRQDDDINYQLLEERNKEERLSCTSEERPGCVFRTEDPHGGPRCGRLAHRTLREVGDKPYLRRDPLECLDHTCLCDSHWKKRYEIKSVLYLEKKVYNLFLCEPPKSSLPPPLPTPRQSPLPPPPKDVPLPPPLVLSPPCVRLDLHLDLGEEEEM
jgi:hypothetical protein